MYSIGINTIVTYTHSQLYLTVTNTTESDERQHHKDANFVGAWWLGIALLSLLRILPCVLLLAVFRGDRSGTMVADINKGEESDRKGEESEERDTLLSPTTTTSLSRYTETKHISLSCSKDVQRSMGNAPSNRRGDAMQGCNEDESLFATLKGDAMLSYVMISDCVVALYRYLVTFSIVDANICLMLRKIFGDSMVLANL